MYVATGNACVEAELRIWVGPDQTCSCSSHEATPTTVPLSTSALLFMEGAHDPSTSMHGKLVDERSMPKADDSSRCAMEAPRR